MVILNFHYGCEEYYFYCIWYFTSNIYYLLYIKFGLNKSILLSLSMRLQEQPSEYMVHIRTRYNAVTSMCNRMGGNAVIKICETRYKQSWFVRHHTPQQVNKNENTSDQRKVHHPHQNRERRKEANGSRSVPSH